MAKKLLEVNNFSGGLNTYADPRDIKDNEFAQNWNAVVDRAGIIRVSGMAEDFINTDYHDSTNFQAGFGLFQFSTEYSVSEIDSNFNTGTTTGTLSAIDANDDEVFTLEDKNSTSSTDDYYNGMIMFIYAGTKIGESRVITDYVGDTRVITTEAFSGALHDKDDASPSKYIIYNWKLDGTNWHGKSETNKIDVITNGYNANMYTGAEFSTNRSDDYYIFSKDTAADDTTVNLGYIEHATGISLKPGVEYSVSFDAAAKNKWYNIISDGNRDGSTSTNYGDKVPWVQLHSEDVEDTSGCVREIEDATPTGGSAGDATYLSATWTVNETGFQIYQDSSTGNGTGAEFFCKTDGSGNPSFYLTPNKGRGYVANEILTFSDPANSSKTANIQVKYINHI